MPDLTTIRRGVVDDALHELLARKLAELNPRVLCGLAELPEGVDLAQPRYCIVTPIPGGILNGPPMTAPEADVTLNYDVTSVGGDRRQANWIAGQVRRVLAGRTTTGALTYPLVCRGHAELDRGSADGGIGAATLLRSVWQSVDSYLLTVSRVADGEEIDPEE